MNPDESPAHNKRTRQRTRDVSFPPENFYPRTKIFSDYVENFCPSLKIFVRLARICLAAFSVLLAACQCFPHYT